MEDDGLFEEFFQEATKIKVIGVGGGGCNAVDRMKENSVKGVTFVAVNTDSQVLRNSKADLRVAIGKRLCRGLGAGQNPDIGEQAAYESEEVLRELVKGVDMVFITAGMGGGTGTGAAPVIAKFAKEAGCLTIAFVTKPFKFEGPLRMKYALQGLDKLRPHVDALIVIPNEKLFSIISRDTSSLEAYREVDNVLRQGVQGISEIIAIRGVCNVDFADVRTTMKNKGTALMGIGVASGENRAILAARRAIQSNLLEVKIDGADSAIVVVSGSEKLTFFELQEAINEVRSASANELNVIYGQVVNNELGDEIVVTVIATGYDQKARDAGIENIPQMIFTNNSEKQLTIEELGGTVEKKNNELDSLFDNQKEEKRDISNDNRNGKRSLPSWLSGGYRKK